MRKFARSIGSEGKSVRPRALNSACVYQVAVFGGSVNGFARLQLQVDHPDTGGYFVRSLHFGAGFPHALQLAGKNCQLRTAYGGESNCIIKT